MFIEEQDSRFGEQDTHTVWVFDPAGLAVIATRYNLQNIQLIVHWVDKK